MCALLRLREMDGSCSFRRCLPLAASRSRGWPLDRVASPDLSPSSPQIIVERAKWAKCWDEIQYCSDRCRSEGKRAKRAAQRGGSEGEGP